MLQGIATVTEKKLKNRNKHQPTKSKLSRRKSPFWCQSLLVLTQGTASALQRVWVWHPWLPFNWWANSMASTSLVLTLQQPALYLTRNTECVQRKAPGPSINVFCYYSAWMLAAAHLAKCLCAKEHIFYKGPNKTENSWKQMACGITACLWPQVSRVPLLLERDEGAYQKSAWGIAISQTSTSRSGPQSAQAGVAWKDVGIRAREVGFEEGLGTIEIISEALWTTTGH